MAARALRVVHHESAGARHELVAADPAPRLRPWVSEYAGYRERASALRRRELPSSQATLVLGFDQRLRVSGPSLGEPAAYDSFVAGLHTAYAVTEFEGASHGVELRLTPLGARALLGVPMVELADRVVALGDLLGQAAALLAERVREASGWQARFDLLDSYLERRLVDARPCTPAIAWAWRRLAETGGQLSIGRLAGELGCSRQYLIAGFRDAIGVPPKAAARILRFERAARLLAAGEPAADVTHACGYYDQPHLSRDVRDLAGTSPGRLAASCTAGGIGLPATSGLTE